MASLRQRHLIALITEFKRKNAFNREKVAFKCDNLLAHLNLSSLSIVIAVVIVVVVNFSQFHLLLQNYWVNFH